MKEDEERSLDRMIESTRRHLAAARAILALKCKLITAGLRLKLTSSEHAMIAARFEGWADEERDPKKAAELASLGAPRPDAVQVRAGAGGEGQATYA
jgi:hypothetical protein